MKSDYKYVNNNWDNKYADTLTSRERLVYRSNILGDDQRITNTGGGNTSSKLMETDPLTAEQTEVLWVKGSGGDLRTSKLANFSSLYQDKLIALQSIYGATEPNGVKTPVEDEMVHMYPHTTFNLNPRPSSIDTPLHSFIGAKHVDHMHPISFIAIAACRNSEALTKEIYGDSLAYLPWQRPGFDLGLKMQAVYQENKACVGINMGQHGLINWADDDKACYELTLDLIEKAGAFIASKDRGDQTFGGQKYTSPSDAAAVAMTIDLLPFLRGAVSQKTRFIGTVHRDAFKSVRESLSDSIATSVSAAADSISSPGTHAAPARNTRSASAYSFALTSMEPSSSHAFACCFCFLIKAQRSAIGRALRVTFPLGSKGEEAGRRWQGFRMRLTRISALLTSLLTKESTGVDANSNSGTPGGTRSSGA